MHQQGFVDQSSSLGVKFIIIAMDWNLDWDRANDGTHANTKHGDWCPKPEIIPGHFFPGTAGSLKYFLHNLYSSQSGYSTSYQSTL